MIKILVINTVRFHTNGMSNIIIDFYQNMDRSNISVDFVVNEIIEKKYEKVIHDHKDKCFILKHRNKIPFFYIHELSKLIRNNDYDIIHIHGNSALMSVELKAIQKSGSIAKVIVHAHNTSCTHLLLNRILYGYFSKHYDYALACSDAAGKWLYKKHPYIVLNNGIDEQRFQYNPEVRDRYRKKYCKIDLSLLMLVDSMNRKTIHF